MSQDKLKLIFFSHSFSYLFDTEKKIFYFILRTLCNETSAISAKDKAAEVEISKRPPPPPPSHLRDALVKEDEENLDDNVEKPPKRKKGSKPREIIKPDPKYKGKLFENNV